MPPIGSTAPTYDADGNQLTGLQPVAALPGNQLTFAYNAQNRPIQVKQGGTVRENYTYDHQGRRIQKGDTLTLYDGYNAIAEYSLHTRILKTTYAWGNDLSGTLQGAGGVGGLLSVTDHTTQISVISYPTYDGNSNITEYLTEESSGLLVSHYEYDAFGNVIKKTGNKEFSYQFSTKPYNNITGLVYYNYRDYDSVFGRWTKRDPIEEEGGINLHIFCNNSAINNIDLLGNNPIYGLIVGDLWGVIEVSVGYKLNHCSQDNDLTKKEGVEECKSCVKTWGNIAHGINLGSGAVGMALCTTITAGWGAFVCGTLTATAMTIAGENIEHSMRSEMLNCKCKT